MTQIERKLDLRIKKTYLALHDALTQLLLEKRFDDITVNLLCERAMIRRTTFYKHFADKYEYPAFYIRELRDGFESQLAPDIASGHSESYFYNMSRELYYFITRNRQLVSNIADSGIGNMLFDILFDLICQDLLELIRGEEPKSSHRAELKAAFLAGGLLYAVKWWLESRSDITESEFTESLVKIIGGGISDKPEK